MLAKKVFVACCFYIGSNSKRNPGVVTRALRSVVGLEGMKSIIFGGKGLSAVCGIVAAKYLKGARIGVMKFLEFFPSKQLVQSLFSKINACSSDAKPSSFVEALSDNIVLDGECKEQLSNALAKKLINTLFQKNSQSDASERDGILK